MSLQRIRLLLMTLLGAASAFAVLYYSRDMIHGFVYPRQFILEILGWAFLILVGVAGMLRGRDMLRMSIAEVFFGIFTLMGFASVAVALSPDEAMIGAMRYAAAFALMLGVSSLFRQSPEQVQTNGGISVANLRAGDAPESAEGMKENLLGFAAIASLAVTLCAALTISQYFGVDGWWKVASNGVGGAVFGNKNMASDVYSITFLLPLVLLWSRRRWLQAYGALAFGLTATALLLTTSKGAFFGMALGLGFMFLLVGYRHWPQWDKTWKQAFFAMIVIVASAGSIYVSTNDDFKGMFSGDAGSLKIRLVYWQNGTQAIRENPLLGVGVDNYPMVHNKYSHAVVDTYSLRENFRITHLHNDYLQAFADQGIPGGVAWTLFWSTIVYLGFVAARSPVGAWPIVLAGALAASFGNSLFNFVYHRPVPVLFLAIISGLLIAAASNTRPMPSWRVRNLVAVPLGVAFIALALLYNIPYLKADSAAAKGMAVFRVNQDVGAQLLETTLKLAPYHQTPINMLISYYAGKQDFANALRIIQDHGLRYDPYNPYTLRVGADLLTMAGEYEQAEQYLARIDAFMPRYGKWYDSALRLAYVQGNHRNVVALLRQSDPEDLSDQAVLMGINAAQRAGEQDAYKRLLALGLQRRIPQVMQLLQERPQEDTQ